MQGYLFTAADLPAWHSRNFLDWSFIGRNSITSKLVHSPFSPWTDIPRSSNHCIAASAMTTALKSIKSLVPLLDRILVQRVKAEAKTASGIYLPESSVKELNEAKVLAVGPGGYDKDGKRLTPSVAPGDKVLIPQYGGSPVKVGDEEYSLFRDHELLAKINE